MGCDPSTKTHISICLKCLNIFFIAEVEKSFREELKKPPWNVPPVILDWLCYDCLYDFKKWFESLNDIERQRLIIKHRNRQ